jgi:hypothetical protein
MSTRIVFRCGEVKLVVEEAFDVVTTRLAGDGLPVFKRHGCDATVAVNPGAVAYVEEITLGPLAAFT